MASIKLRDKSYEVNQFTDLHLAPLANFLIKLNNSDGKFLDYGDLGKMLRKFFLPDVDEDIVSDENVNLTVEELLNLYKDLVKIYDKKTEEVDEEYVDEEDEEDEDYPSPQRNPKRNPKRTR